MNPAVRPMLLEFEPGHLKVRPTQDMPRNALKARRFPINAWLLHEWWASSASRTSSLEVGKE